MSVSMEVFPSLQHRSSIIQVPPAPNSGDDRYLQGIVVDMLAKYKIEGCARLTVRPLRTVTWTFFNGRWKSNVMKSNDAERNTR